MAPKRKEKTEAKPPKAKKSKASEGDDGWMPHEKSLLYKPQTLKAGDKVAAFDLDGTLVNTATGGDFARDANDWVFFNPKVPSCVQKLHEDGYRIVIFSNQGSIKSALEGKGAAKCKGRIDNVLKALGVPTAVYVATNKDHFRKPETGMWDFMCEHHFSEGKPDLDASYFVGDAGGRQGDFAASDREFAEAVGIAYKRPEDCFGEKEVVIASRTNPQAKVAENAELCACFDKLAQHIGQRGEFFRSNAFKKVSSAIAEHDEKISSGKQAGALKGVGKGSIGLIDEWLKSGKMQVLEDFEKGEGQDSKVSEGGSADSKADTKGKTDTKKEDNPGLKFL